MPARLSSTGAISTINTMIAPFLVSTTHPCYLPFQRKSFYLSQLPNTQSRSPTHPSPLRIDIRLSPASLVFRTTPLFAHTHAKSKMVKQSSLHPKRGRTSFVRRSPPRQCVSSPIPPTFLSGAGEGPLAASVWLDLHARRPTTPVIHHTPLTRTYLCISAHGGAINRLARISRLPTYLPYPHLSPLSIQASLLPLQRSRAGAIAVKHLHDMTQWPKVSL
ncbi:hypothetical protein EDB81DRAFT_57422 [Dactylonectria macrodidyma]|uniref:Uncharacterized protein n=1 Tax=Dactylonectria macrodidyma TaxID=307937 RepID=A0A9P9EP42_9HYPO|nr:hypothetical protein EDB81DRAFT_57422 [Dactylonectria macrodidyma]